MANGKGNAAPTHCKASTYIMNNFSPNVNPHPLTREFFFKALSHKDFSEGG